MVFVSHDYFAFPEVSVVSTTQATLKAIEKAGGKVVTPKHSIDGWGFMADFADPEGNVLSLWERPKN